MDVLSKEQRHKNMSRVRSKDTCGEILLRKALWKKGIRYRKNWKKLAGTPDIVITKYRIAVFVDGDFWHARNHLKNPGEQIGTNQAFWRKKLKDNVARDRDVNMELTEQGWLVLRFWESDVKKDVDSCVAQILEYIPPS